MGTFLRRVWYLVNRRRHERELVAEMHEHRGLMHDPAKFGDTHRMLEQSRDAWGWNWLDDAAQDLKQGVRTLWRAPVFAITATLILSFGIGLNLTLYQMANVALLRGPDVKDRETLARFNRRAPGKGAPSLPYPLAEAVARQNHVLSAVLLGITAIVGWGEDVRIVNALFVSPTGSLSLAARRRSDACFSEAADTIASPPVVVVSEQFWRVAARLRTRRSSVQSSASIACPVTIDRRDAAREFTGTQPRSTGRVAGDRISATSVFPDSPFLRSWEGEQHGVLRPLEARRHTGRRARKHARADDAACDEQ